MFTPTSDLIILDVENDVSEVIAGLNLRQAFTRLSFVEILDKSEFLGEL